MSIALIRGNMLTQLANREKSAVEETDRVLREFLTDKPGPWLPEDFFAPYELVERSIDAATPEGKHTLLRLLHQLVGELFSVIELEARKLIEEESRQLLGTMAIVGKHEILQESKYPDVLEFAVRQPALFWHRVGAPVDIVSDRERFVEILVKRLPEKIRQRIQHRLAPAESLLEQIIYLFKNRPQKKVWGRALLKGEVVEVEMVLNGKLRKAGVVRITGRKNAIIIDGAEFNLFSHRTGLPAVPLGEVYVEVASQRNIANWASTRFNDSVETSMLLRR